MLTISEVSLNGILVNIKVDNGRIIEIEECGKAEPTSWVVFPGVICLHVHSCQPNENEDGQPKPDFQQKEDWDHLWRAAVKGGVTGMAVMPSTSPAITILAVLEKARKLASCSPIQPRYWFGTPAPGNYGEMRRAAKEPDVIGFKLFMCSSTGNMLVCREEDQRRILQVGAETGKLVAVHCGDESIIKRNEAELRCRRELKFSDHPTIRSVAAKVAGVRQILRLGKETGCRLHICHVSSVEALDLICQAKEEGQAVTAEGSPHYFFLSQDCLDFPEDAWRYKMNPSLRSEAERQELLARFIAGQFDTIGSDHAPWIKKEKAKPYSDCPSGIPGIETMLPLFDNEALAGSLSWERLAHCACVKPAEIAGIKNKGVIASGYDADLVLIDPMAETSITDESIVCKCGWTPYHGMILKGRIVATMLGGEFVYDISGH